jgi:hypothetical protein
VKTAMLPQATGSPSEMLARIEQVQRARRSVRMGRRVFLSLAAALGTLVVGRAVLASGGGDASGWAFGLAAPTAALLMWRFSRDARPDLARTALWVEERRAQREGSPADFSLTTAVELLAAGNTLPTALEQAASRTLSTAPTYGAISAERRRAWQWPALFSLLCMALVLLDLRRSKADSVGNGAHAEVVKSGGAAATASSAPLGTWEVRVEPPAYAALPVLAFGDVNTVSALSGSTITVSGDGTAPSVQVTVVDSALAGRSRAVVSAADDAWRAVMIATTGAHTARLERGGRTRLLIIEGHADSVPRVSLDAPVRDSVFREARGVLPLAASAHDDIGLTRAHFELLVTSGEGERFTVRTVLLGAQQWAGRAGMKEARIRGQLDLAALQLQAGDVVHLRAVARDGHPDASREFGSSETRAFRIARPSEYDSVAVEPAPPPEVDKSLLSQRMLLMLTEKLDKAQRRMARPEVLRESQKLARDQARLRLAVGDVVFQRLSGESAAEHAHTAGDGHDHGVDVQGGKLSLSTSSTTGMLEEGNDSPVIAINQPLLEAYNAMWDAGRALEQGDPHGAIPPMKRALEAIERSRAASRLYLRGRPPQVIVDIAKVRLSGKDTGQVTVRSARSAVPSPDAARDVRLVRAARLAAASSGAARDSVALLRVESLADAPGFASALSGVLEVLDRGGDATAAFVQARRVLGNVQRTRATPWSRGVSP